MREILFRAKAINRDDNSERKTDYKNGDWVYGLVTRPYDEKHNIPMTMRNTDGIDGIEVDHETLGQYTGLTDKNGVRIFEGDIVKKRVSHGYENYPVQLKRGSFTASVYTIDDVRILVVGNYFDNPEISKSSYPCDCDYIKIRIKT